MGPDLVETANHLEIANHRSSVCGCRRRLAMPEKDVDEMGDAQEVWAGSRDHLAKRLLFRSSYLSSGSLRHSFPCRFLCSVFYRLEIFSREASSYVQKVFPDRAPGSTA